MKNEVSSQKGTWEQTASFLTRRGSDRKATNLQQRSKQCVEIMNIYSCIRMMVC